MITIRPRPPSREKNGECVHCGKQAFGIVPDTDIPLCLYHYKSCYLWPSMVMQVVKAKGSTCSDCGRIGAHLAPFALLNRDPDGKPPLRIIKLTKPELVIVEEIDITCYRCTKASLAHVRFSPNWPFPSYHEGKISQLWVPGAEWVGTTMRVEKADGHVLT